MAVVKRMKGDLDKRVAKKTKTAESAEGFKMPTSKNVPPDNLWDYITLLFGEKKIGKTSLLAAADGTFYFMFEPGAKSLSVYQHLFTRWADFKMAVTAFIKDPRFTIAVIDTVDLCYKMAEAYTLKRLGIEHASDEAYGKGWSAIRQEFTDQIMRIVNSGKGVVFISHATEKEVTLRGGGKYDKLMPTMPGQARDVIEGLVDIWGYYGYDGKDRVLTILGDDHIAAGHRLEHHFHAPDGTPLREIHMGSSAKEAYKNFIDAFNNRYTPKSKKTTDAPKKTGVVKKTLKKAS